MKEGNWGLTHRERIKSVEGLSTMVRLFIETSEDNGQNFTATHLRKRKSSWNWVVYHSTDWYSGKNNLSNNQARRYLTIFLPLVMVYWWIKCSMSSRESRLMHCRQPHDTKLAADEEMLGNSAAATRWLIVTQHRIHKRQKQHLR